MSQGSKEVDLRSLAFEAAKKLKEAKAELAQLKRDRNEAVAVVGVGCRFPGDSGTPRTFWQLLAEGRDAITEVPADRWSLSEFHDADPEAPGKMTSRHGGFVKCPVEFDAAFFRIAPREAVALDPQQRLLLEVAWEALENAAIAPDQIAGTRTGVFVGICSVDYYQRILARGANEIDEYLGAGVAHSMAAGRLAYILGVHGPAFAMDTACSSSLLAIHLACQSLRCGESDMALAGGVNLLLSPETSVSFSKARMVSPDGRCKTFDAEANGYVRGEGCGMAVLKRLSDALRDGDPILAVVRGSAVNHDGRTSGLTVPNGPAQERLIQEALTNAGVKPGDVQYVEAHGTGTSLGDPIELGALGAVFGPGRTAQESLLVGSVKTNLGHLEGAAGIAGFIKTVLALHRRRIPPHLHFKKPNPLVDWSGLRLSVPTSEVPWPGTARLAGVTSLGFSGTNVHVVLEGAPEQESSRPPDMDLLLALSARTDEALRELARLYLGMFESLPESEYAMVCAQSNFGRAQMEHRIAFAPVDPRGLREELRAFAGGGTARFAGTTSLEESGEPQLKMGDPFQREGIAREFVRGTTITWRQLYPGLRRVPLDLPNYPFQRKRYWVEPIQSTTDRTYDLVWRQLVSRQGEPDLPGKWLVVAMPGDRRDEMARAFRTARAEVVLVNGSSGFDPGILDQLWSGIVFLHPEKSVESVSLEEGARDLLAIVQALVQKPATRRGKLWIVTTGARSVGGEAPRLEEASVHGLCNVIAMEHPGLFGAVLDLDPKDPPSIQFKELLNEITGMAGEPVVAWRSGYRFVPRLIASPPSARAMFKCSPDACYLVTGGLGGLGSTVVDGLVRRGAGRVFVTTRQAGMGTPSKSGASVHKVDLTNRESVEALFTEIKDCGLPLRGIMHCAGGVDDGALTGQTWDRFAAVLAPKVGGSWLLHKAADRTPLDFFVLFSSITSLLGSFGQGSYAAANAFQDGLAHYRRSRGLPALSINWGPWAEVGMAARLGERERRRIGDQGFRELSPDRALETLFRAIGSPEAQIAIVDADWAQFLRDGSGGRSAPLLDELLPGKESAAALLKLEGLSESEKRENISALVNGEVAASLGLDEIEAQNDRRGFFALGMDSLMSLRLRSSLELRTGLTLPATLAFEYSNCVDLAAYLSERLGVPCEESGHSRPSPKAAEQVPRTFDGLSEGEIDRLLSQRLENL